MYIEEEVKKMRQNVNFDHVMVGAQANMPGPQREENGALLPLRNAGHMRAITLTAGYSNLKRLSLGIVTQFVLDYMKIVCLGATRKLLQFWIKGGPEVLIELSL